MRQDPRPRRILKWAWLVAFCFVTCLWLSTLLIRFRLSVPRGITLGTYDGCVLLARNTASGQFPMGFYYRPESRPHFKNELSFQSGPAGAWSGRAPIWPMCLIAAMPTAWAWMSDARERRLLLVGHCSRCGYDRRGLEGLCPECGCAAVTPPSPPTHPAHP
jgi:hypothetical protein